MQRATFVRWMQALWPPRRRQILGIAAWAIAAALFIIGGQTGRHVLGVTGAVLRAVGPALFWSARARFAQGNEAAKKTEPPRGEPPMARGLGG